MELITSSATNAFTQTLISLSHNWPFILISILAAVLMKQFLDPQKVSAFFIKYKNAGMVGATAAAVATPLCSCGTTAVVIGLIATMVPWSPVIAFMVASPLTSPEELIYSAGIFGWPFAIAFFVSSILLGLAGGAIAAFFESRGWLKNQTRFTRPVETAERPAKQACCQPVKTTHLTKPDPMVMRLQPALATDCCASSASFDCSLPVLTCSCEPAPACTDCPSVPQNDGMPKMTLAGFASETFEVGKRLLLIFIAFAFIGYFLNGLIPSSIIAGLFGIGNRYSIPLAATLGLPFYINTEASLPLLRGLIDGGMSQGAALAFLITGAGTSLGAVSGALTIARWRVIAIVVGTLWVGGMILGYSYELLLSAGIL